MNGVEQNDSMSFISAWLPILMFLDAASKRGRHLLSPALHINGKWSLVIAIVYFYANIILAPVR